MAVLCMGIMAAVFFGDMLLKNRIEKRLREGECRPVWGGRLLLRRYHNRGAALNLGERRRPLVAVLSLILTVVSCMAFVCSLGSRGNALLRTGLSFLLGGAFSNTYDRLRRKYVVDYVSFPVKWERLGRIVFNISDFCIMTGALLAVLGTAR